MLKNIRFPNKLLSLDYNENFILLGDNKGFVYKYKDSQISKIFFCDSPISNLQIYNEDVFYTTWDGDIYKNTVKINLATGIIKAMLIFNNLIYVSLDLKVYVLSLNLEVVKVIEVPHKVLCFCSVGNFIVCGLNLPMLGIIDEDFNLSVKSVLHDTGVLTVRNCKNMILTGSVDGSVQKYSEADVFYSDISTNRNFIIEISNKWIRDIFDDTLFSKGNEVIYNSTTIYEHFDDVMRVIKYKGSIISIGLDCIMNIYTEDTLLDDELEEIAKLNALY